MQQREEQKNQRSQQADGLIVKPILSITGACAILAVQEMLFLGTAGAAAKASEYIFVVAPLASNI